MYRSLRGMVLFVMIGMLLFTLPQVSRAAASIESAVAMGAAGANAVDLGGLHAVTWNPAAMGMNPQSIRIGVTPAALRVMTSEGLSAPLIRFLMGTASDADTAQSFDGMSGDALGIIVRSRHVLQAALGKHIGLSASANAFIDGTLSRDFIDLVANGPSSGNTYELDGTQLDWAGYFDVGGALAIPLWSDRLYVGVGGRRLFGWGYGKAELETDMWDPDQPDQPQIKVLSADEGDGFAFDLGFAWQVTPQLTADLSWLNVGRMTWHDAVITTYAYDKDAPGSASLEVIDESVQDAIHWSTPQTVRFGLGIEANPSVRWALEIARDLGRPSGEGTRISIGAENRRLASLPVRFGIKYAVGEGDLVFSAGMGLHLGPLVLDVGIPNLSALLGGEREVGIAVSTGLRF